MDWTLWAGFVVASLIVGLLPGPGVTSIVGYALTAGMRTALGSVFGATFGNAVAMTMSLVGVGVLLSQSPTAFLLLKWLGPDGAPRTIKPSAAFWGTFAITAVNPKTIIFFVAFTPQFISPDYAYWPQAGFLLMTFCVVVTLSDGFYAVAASWAASFLKGPEVQLWSQRVGGAVLVAAGLLTALFAN